MLTTLIGIVLGRIFRVMGLPTTLVIQQQTIGIECAAAPETLQTDRVLPALAEMVFGDVSGTRKIMITQIFGTGETKHSDEADSSTASASPGFAPSSGSYTASAGDTHTGTVTASSIYGAYFYVNGVSQGWFSGSTTATSLSLTYTFASDASGSYTMMARVYPWSGSTYGNYTDYSYTVTIGSSDSTTTPTSTPSTPSTPSYHTCGVHETSVSGTHSAAGCGVSGHYVCDGSDHSLQASCTTTNASGQYCTVSSFYACQSHTHVYKVVCRNRYCDELVDDWMEHVVTCRNGHRYWSCLPSHHEYHTTSCSP